MEGAEATGLVRFARSVFIVWMDVPCGNRSFTFVKNPKRFERIVFRFNKILNIILH